MGDIWLYGTDYTHMGQIYPCYQGGYSGHATPKLVEPRSYITFDVYNNLGPIYAFR